MHFPPKQVKILQAALALWRSVIVDEQPLPSDEDLARLQHQAGLKHVYGWHPPQIEERSLKAHLTNLRCLENKLLHEEQVETRALKKWIRRGQLPDDVDTMEGALEAAARMLDKACAEQILEMPVFLGDDGLFYVMEVQAEINFCTSDFAEQIVEECLEDLLDDSAELEIPCASEPPVVDELRQALEHHREIVEKMYGPNTCPAYKGKLGYEEVEGPVNDEVEGQ